MSLVTPQLDEMEDLLNRILHVANKNELIIYQTIAYKELELSLQHKQRISYILEIQSPVEQKSRIKEYLSRAISLMREEELV